MKLRSSRLSLLLVGMALALSACASDAPQDFTKPEGPIAKQVDRLFDPVFAVAVVVFVLVEGLVLYVAMRFRERPGHDDAPTQTHGNTRLEITWTIIPALLLAVIGVFTVVTILDINKVDATGEALEVDVYGHQWWWEYRYPGEGVITANELHIPTGRRVELKLQSKDVIHSFWPPKLAGKVDVVPGHVNHMAIEATEPGTYYGQCAEFCGLSHSRMRLRVVAHSPAEFATWLAGQKQQPAKPSTSDEGAALFQSKGCAGCHTVAGFTAGEIGPNLTHLYSRKTFAGAIFDLNEQNLRTWLRDPQGRKPGSLMKLPVKLNEEEITKLIAYLETLK
ncbi:MAG TPA: cytochrome c oxidase subunit II [Acidimicrobiales bacterium]|nr:cytochrome c oxidase subunit II [Acidimicrobiales bacterium]